jgi:hypothetical protein
MMELMCYPMRILCGVLACCVALAVTPRPGLAQDRQTVAVLSFPGADQVRSDLELLGSAIDNPDFAPVVIDALAKLTGCSSLEGIDGARPWGLVVQSDGLQVTPVAFLPVTNVEAWLASCEPLIGPFERVENGLLKIGRRTATGYVRAHGEWAYLAQSASDLADLPDPAAALAIVPAVFGRATSAGEAGGMLDVGRLP